MNIKDKSLVLENNKIRCILNLLPNGELRLESLCNKLTGFDWAIKESSTGIYLLLSNLEIVDSLVGFKPVNATLYENENGVLQAEISLIKETGMQITSYYTIYPNLPIISYSCKIKNIGETSLPGIKWLGPFCIRIQSEIFPFILYNIPILQKDNLDIIEKESILREKITLDGWSALLTKKTNEVLFIASELSGHEIFPWRVIFRPEDNSILVCAGIGELDSSDKCINYIFNPNESIESPEIFLILTSGDLDNACNELRHFLKSFILPKPIQNLPLLSYNVWYTEVNAEELYLEDLEFASRMGFDCFVIDASWYEGSSIIPASNDWSSGLGSYKESKEKFPQGIEYLSRKVHEKGMKFGIWVDPQNVDRRRILSGEIPHSWVAQIDGQDLECWHPSLTPTTQLCLGNPEVVEWLKGQLSNIIEEWHIDWIKWDPSATVSYFCNRTDHGHKKENGAYAYMKGRREIFSYILRQFPNLLGWECIPDLKYSRINPGCRYILPAATNIFVTGPMLGPYVWGSMHMAYQTADSRYSINVGTYYEASYLDYYFRNLLVQGGLSIGNITGLVSQRLKNAPLGFNDAFKRNILHFKQYRHLYNENIYYLDMDITQKWRAIEYCKQDTSEAVVFIFRDGSQYNSNTVRLKGLDLSAKYLLKSLNERPGREKVISSRDLSNKGIEITLPSSYLATADYEIYRLDEQVQKDLKKQLQYGSDILILNKII